MPDKEPTRDELNAVAGQADQTPLGDIVREAYAEAEENMNDQTPPEDSPPAAEASDQDGAEDHGETGEDADGTGDDTGAEADQADAAPDEGEEKADGEADPTGERDDAGDGPSIEPPATLSEAHRAEFRSLPVAAQKIVRDRLAEQQADYTRKTTEAADLHKSAEPILAVMEPYKGYFQRLNTTPEKAVGVLMQTETTLRLGTPEQKNRVFAQLLKEYGVDVDALSDLADDANDDDPKLAEANQRIARLESGQEAERQRETAARETAAVEQVTAFVEATDESGALLHPHFKRVEQDIANFIAADPNLPLADAYERAVWAEPELRETLIAERSGAAAKTAAADAAAKAATKAKAEKAERDKHAKAARKAGVGVTAGSETAGVPAAGGQTLRETIEEAHRQASSP